jgi:nucleoside 2-deoxyribosyltransferase
MSKLKCYLAGRMSGLTFEQMNSWREKTTKLLKEKSDNTIHTENPCHYYSFELEPSTYTEKEVKEFDLFLVKNCDIVLVNLNFADSIGTAIETHMAHDVWDIPVIAVKSKNNISHPWIDLSVTKFCETIEEAVDHIVEFYLPNIVV